MNRFQARGAISHCGPELAFGCAVERRAETIRRTGQPPNDSRLKAASTAARQHYQLEPPLPPENCELVLTSARHSDRTANGIRANSKLIIQSSSAEGGQPGRRNRESRDRPASNASVHSNAREACKRWALQESYD